MKTVTTLILILSSCGLSYSQQLDSDIESVKKEIIGTWVPNDTILKEKYVYQFTAKKFTFTMNCENGAVLKKAVRYSLKKEYVPEFKRDIIVVVIPGSGKLASHDCDPCREKTLDHLTFQNMMDVVIKNGKLTSRPEIGNSPEELIKTTK